MEGTRQDEKGTFSTFLRQQLERFFLFVPEELVFDGEREIFAGIHRESMGEPT